MRQERFYDLDVYVDDPSQLDELVAGLDVTWECVGGQLMRFTGPTGHMLVMLARLVDHDLERIGSLWGYRELVRGERHRELRERRQR